MERADLLSSYVGPAFFRHRVPVGGALGRRLNSSRVVLRRPKDYRPLVASEVAGLRNSDWRERVRDWEANFWLHNCDNLVFTAGAVSQKVTSKVPGLRIAERRANAPDDYRRLIKRAREAGADVPDWHEANEKGLMAQLGECDGVIVYSRRSAQSFDQLDPNRLKVVPLGMDAPRLPLKQCRDRVRIGFAGRLDFPKGYDEFVRLSRTLANRADFVVAGSVNAWAADITPGHVQMRGRLSQLELQAFWNDIDILLLPSRLESFGLVAYEALTHGVVPLVSRQTGVSETLSSELDGELVFEDIEEVAPLVDSGRLHQLSSSLDVERFARSHSWSSFGQRFAEAVNHIGQCRS